MGVVKGQTRGNHQILKLTLIPRLQAEGQQISHHYGVGGRSPVQDSQHNVGGEYVLCWQMFYLHWMAAVCVLKTG